VASRELRHDKEDQIIGAVKQQFGAFRASELFCAKCQRSQPVRERLLLVLPSGELHEYLCSRCGSSVGTRSVSAAENRPPIAVTGPGPAKR
jgi:hypothetical protein